MLELCKKGPFGIHSVEDPGFWSGGPKIFFWEFADGAKQSCMNEVSLRWLGALEALGFFIAKCVFSYFSWYLLCVWFFLK